MPVPCPFNQIRFRHAHRLTVHSLRHTFAMALLHRDLPITDIQRLLGHADLETTTIYLHADMRKIRQGVENLEY